MQYKDMLSTLAKARGLIFLPSAGDTCPRIVIEAKLLGCELILNENVMHKEESWFKKSKKEIYAYLLNRVNVFWEFIAE